MHVCFFVVAEYMHVYTTPVCRITLPVWETNVSLSACSTAIVNAFLRAITSSPER